MNDDSDEIELSALHRRVKWNQDLYNLRMIKKKEVVVIQYLRGQIILLKIPKKNKQNVKAKRLPCRVIDIKGGT
jgi:hypothetical protein